MALALLILPLKWIAAAVAAAAFHELCHYLALRVCGVKVFQITIGAHGALMDTEPMAPKTELICALAGPAGSLLLILLIRWMPELAVCGGIHGFFNLLPCLPLDGGRVLSCFMEILCPLRRVKLMRCVQIAASSFIILLSFILFFILKMGYGVLLLGFSLILKTFPRKSPCKEGRKRVQ